MAGNGNSGRKRGLSKLNIIDFLTSIGRYDPMFDVWIDQYMYHYNIDRLLRKKLEDVDSLIVKHHNHVRGESPEFKILKDAQKSMQSISVKLGLSVYDLEKLGVVWDNGSEEEGEEV